MVYRFKKNNRTFAIFLFFLTSIISFTCIISKEDQKLTVQSATSEMYENNKNYNEELKSDISITRFNGTHKQEKKNWTFIVYMAADNDLRSFAANNIKQMAAIGSNQWLNIVIHLDIRLTNNQKTTRRYFIEKNKLVHINNGDPTSQQMDSGDEKTLISCCKWAIENYPAQHYALILWNHGTGILDPLRGRIFNPFELFTFNPATHKLELDRSVGFLDLINYMSQDKRGICWDNSTGNYLTNQKLAYALKTVCANYLNGNKFSIIGFDACLMAMLEVANIAKSYAHIMIGSQEVELGTGWDYSKVLELFLRTNPSPEEFVKHTIHMFEKTYNNITNDFTQSAINLNLLDQLENNVDIIAGLLLECIRKQINNSVMNAIKASRNRLLCTHFDEPSYIDLHHFFYNLQSNIKHFALINKQEEYSYKENLTKKLEETNRYIEKIVIANTTGSNLRNARGISIYFPERKIHGSYANTLFAQTNNWLELLNYYLLG